MRFIKNISEFIIESANSYEFKLLSDNPRLYKYEFFDEAENKYLVEFKNIPINRSDKLSNTFELLYYVLDGSTYSVIKVVNVNLFRTIKTILGDILNDFSKRCSWSKEVFFIGLGKDREREYITKRTKVYKRYLDMNPPKDFTVKQSGNIIRLRRV